MRLHNFISCWVRAMCVKLPTRYLKSPWRRCDKRQDIKSRFYRTDVYVEQRTGNLEAVNRELDTALGRQAPASSLPATAAQLQASAFRLETAATFMITLIIDQA
jgi:hypothetical protein